MKRWPIVVGTIICLSASLSLAQEDSLSAAGDSAGSAGDIQATNEESSLSSQARKFLEVAKERLASAEREKKERREAKERAKAERRRAKEMARAERKKAKQRAAALKLGMQMARDKAKAQTEREKKAQRQLRLAREYKLKALYKKGTDLYRRGDYKEAIDVLQQMALVDPSHPLVASAERLITRAELKRFEQQVRVHAALPAGPEGAAVSELERLLANKRMELETVFKYAKRAMQERDYDSAIKLLTSMLVQDPSHKQALALLQQAKFAKLKKEEHKLWQQVGQDEQYMINEVARAQLIPKKHTAVPPPLPPLVVRSRSRLLSKKLSEPMSFDFKDVALSDVLDFIADAAGLSIIPSPQLDLEGRRVSLKMNEVPLEQAIKYVAKSLDLTYRVEDDAIRIATEEEFSKEPMETRVFFLKSGLGPFALKNSALEPNPVLTTEPITSLIEQTVPQPSGSRLVLDERSGSLVALNTSENLDRIEQLLSQLDVTPIQVLIESRFVELTMTDLEQRSFESVLNGNVSLTKKGDTDSTRGAGHEIASGGGSTFASLSREDEGLNLTLEGILTGTQFEAVMHFLEETQKAKTLSAPRVTTLNNQPALIRVVDEFRYPTHYEVSLIQFDTNGDGDFDDANETEFANVPQDFKERDVGIRMNVTPSVGKDLKTITLIVAPEVSSFSQFRDLGGDVTVPEFTTSQLTTNVVLDDGQTVLLGGLMKDTTSDNLSKIPFLGDLPIVGGLFRQHSSSEARKNLLIFITARILAPRGQTI